MADDKTDVVAVPTVTVAVVGTGDGGLTHPLHDTIAVTPDHLPNVSVKVIAPLVAIGVRFGNIYLNSLSGFLVAATMTPQGAKLLGGREFSHTLYVCAGLAVAPAMVGFVKDLVTIFGKLEGKYPLLTGSI